MRAGSLAAELGERAVGARAQATVIMTAPPPSSEDRQWTEGKPRLITHLRKERASGLAQAKKDWFVRTHGRLLCKRCGMDPIEVYYGEHGAACIEVHHHVVRVEEMAEANQTRLEDLQCLCAIKLALEQDFRDYARETKVSR